MQNSFENFKNLINDNLKKENKTLKRSKNLNIFFFIGSVDWYREMILECAEKSNYNRLNKYNIWEMDSEYDSESRVFIKFELFDINSFFEI